jgi:hypothetical protein
VPWATMSTTPRSPLPRRQMTCSSTEPIALFVTADKDFGELVFRLHRIHAGVILLRLAGLSADSKCEHVAAVLQTRAGELVGAFTVITPGLVRIRQRE